MCCEVCRCRGYAVCPSKIHKAQTPYYIVVCGLSGCTVFCHIILQTVRFVEHKMCVLVFYVTFVWNVSHFKKNLARYCYKCRVSLLKWVVNMVTSGLRMFKHRAMKRYGGMVLQVHESVTAVDFRKSIRWRKCLLCDNSVSPSMCNLILCRKTCCYAIKIAAKSTLCPLWKICVYGWRGYWKPWDCTNQVKTL
jgi:hypothetical protein